MTMAPFVNHTNRSFGGLAGPLSQPAAASFSLGNLSIVLFTLRKCYAVHKSRLNYTASWLTQLSSKQSNQCLLNT